MNAVNRWIVLLLTLAVAVWTAGTPPASAREVLSSRTHIFYYPWYQNPALSGFYRHWQERIFAPPDNISSNYYPVLGAYDSGDFKHAVAQQMEQIRRAGVGVIVYSWWGQDSLEDRYVLGTMNVADRYGIKVAWHIEPYVGRTAASVAGDIAYINTQYGEHPAFFRTLRSLSRDGDKGVFYIYNSLLTTDWSPLRAVHAGNLFLAQTTDVSRVADFDGMYTYAIADGLGEGWADASAYALAHRMIWAPSIGPGYIDDRAIPGNSSPTLDRSNGATYDLEWQVALNPSDGAPYWITITSFNEWHEGTQIEAASSTPPTGFGYMTYEHAYGRTGRSAETAYIARTRVWVDTFDPDPDNPNLIPNGSFETAGGSTTKARSWLPGSLHGRSTERAHLGRWALRSTFIGSSANTGADTHLAAIAVTPDTDYVLSGWVYKDSGRGAACLDMNDISGELQICAGPAMGWQLVSGTWNSGTHREVVIRLVTDNPNGPIYFDDIALRVADGQP
jgi:hypothetical protein